MKEPARTIPCSHCDGTGRVPDWRIYGQAMRELRQARGLGLREVSRVAGCSPCYVTDLEVGKRAWNGPKARAVRAVIVGRGGA